MTDPTPAQQEFAQLVAKNNAEHFTPVHPEDRELYRQERQGEDLTEEDGYRNAQIDAAMRIPAFDRVNGSTGADLKLPPASFDSGRSTGVKGVIADARSYEAARRNKWLNAVRTARRSIFGTDGHVNNKPHVESDTDGDASGSDAPDEEAFIAQWRESRRRELESEANRAIRTRRTSPSVRVFGRFDSVDAMGYLDAIEKVGRETVVVVYVYDHEVSFALRPRPSTARKANPAQCLVSSEIEKALLPMVANYPTVHFVKVHYEDIEFDNAGVPAILAYKNQGDLFANLTGIMEMIPDEDFATPSLTRLFQKHGIL